MPIVCSFCATPDSSFLVTSRGAMICGECIVVAVDAMAHRADGFVSGEVRPARVYQFRVLATPETTPTPPAAPGEE